MPLRHVLKTGKYGIKHFYILILQLGNKGIEIGFFVESYPKVSGVRFRICIYFIWGQMADQLISKEVEGHTIIVFPAKLTAQLKLIKISSLL